jgi:hypothetical protein
MSHRSLIALSAAGAFALVTWAPSWTADIKATDGSTITGTATVDSRTAAKPMTSDTAMPAKPEVKDELSATVSVSKAKANASLAWHVHNGKCGANAGTIVGDETGYRNLTTNEKGDGTVTATIAGAALDAGQDYSVMVHGGGSKTTPAIACGDLKRKEAVPN